MKRILIRESAWFVSNLALLLVGLFVVALYQATVMLVTSADGSLGDGGSGPAVEQVLGWAYFGAVLAIVYFTPLLAVALIPYRVAARLTGRPRIVAVVEALALVPIVAVLAPGMDLRSLALLGLIAVGYAFLLRLPGHTLGDFPGPLSGAITGFALSFVWLLGSFVAFGWATRRASQGAWTEAGAIACMGAVVPAMLMFVDLFRDGVPDTNYLITALFAGGLVFGLAACGRASLRRRLVGQAGRPAG